MALRLNLAALTAEELARLLGPGRAQQLLPEIGAARLAARPYPGPALGSELHFEPLAPRAWGASSEQARKIASLAAGLEAQGFTPLGALCLGGEAAPYRLAYLNGQDSAAAVCWDEAPDGPTPFLQLLSLLRDRASGVAAVLTLTAAGPPAPAPSEEIDLQLLPGANAPEALAAHAARLTRHGRGVKLASLTDFTRAFQVVRGLDLAAWKRRGLMMEER